METIFQILIFIAGLVALSTIIASLFLSGAVGCTGNCNQGRNTCDCKEDDHG